MFKTAEHFWIVVGIGLLVSFICAAAELAFGLACGESSASDIYKKNLQISKDQLAIVESNAADREKQIASVKAAQAQLLLQIGENYSTRYNPTLVVTNNVANIVVAVVSVAATFAIPQVDSVGSVCPWLNSWTWIVQNLPPLRCWEWSGHFIPFPVNNEVFQSALALTFILVIGDIIPKQLATAFPERMTSLLHPAYRLISIFSLGTGPAFGALGRLVQGLVRSARPNWN